MKRLMCIILCLCMAMAFSACSQDDTTSVKDEPTFSGFDYWEDTSTQVQKESDTPTIDPWNEHTEVWGTPQICTVTTGGTAITYTCNIPEADIISDAQATVYVRCTDGKNLFLGSPDDTYPIPESLDLVFETYLEKITETIEAARLSVYTDYSLTLEEQEIVEIEGRQMLKVHGTMDYLDQGNQRNWVFLGYATELSNGTYTYWLATYYTGNDYVGLKRIAENMARSFTEVS